MKNRELHVSEATTPAELDEHAAAWDALLPQCASASPVHSYSWMRAFFSLRVPPGTRWTCLFAYEGNTLAAVLPLIEGSVRGLPGLRLQRWHPPRNVFHTTRVDMVCAPGREQAMEGFLRFLRSTRRAWPVLSFQALPEGSPTLAYAKTRARRVRVRPGGAENVIPLSDGHPAYREGLSGKFLRELRRRARKLETLGHVGVFLNETRRPVAENLSRFLTVEDSGWKGEGNSSIARIPGESQFYLEATRGLAERGWLEWNFLELDGRTIAGQIALRSGHTLYILKVGYEKEFSTFAPGNLLLEKVIENACRTGNVDTINFLALCDWHLDWGVRPAPLHEATVYPLPVVRPGWPM